MQNRGMEEEGHSYVEHFEFEAECNTLSFSRQTIFRYYIVVTAKLYYIPGCYSKIILYIRLLQQNYIIIYQVVTAKLYYISGCYSKIRDIKVVECKAVCVYTVSFNGHFW